MQPIDKFKQAIQLFQTAEQKMLDYAIKIEHLQRLIKQRLEKGTPLPEDARVTLHTPDNEVFLADALAEWEKGKEATLNIVSGMRRYLGKYNIGMAMYTITSWSNSIDRPMERILNQTYSYSDILPPPHLYLSEIDDQLELLFPVHEPDSLNSPHENAFINYLKSTGNPWEKYVKK